MPNVRLLAEADVGVCHVKRHIDGGTGLVERGVERQAFLGTGRTTGRCQIRAGGVAVTDVRLAILDVRAVVSRLDELLRRPCGADVE